MSVCTIQHSWKNHDVSYLRGDKTIALVIGAASYTGLVKVYDYTDMLPSGSESGQISIGKFCSIADNITITLFGGHNYKNITTSPLIPICSDYKKYAQPVKSENVTIGNDVWIGNDVSILSNVTIGNGAVIGANSVVSKDVPPYAIAVGNPCRIIKFRFSDDQINKLLEIAWWDWPHDRIKNNFELLFGDKIDEFIDANYTLK